MRPRAAGRSPSPTATTDDCCGATALPDVGRSRSRPEAVLPAQRTLDRQTSLGSHVPRTAAVDRTASPPFGHAARPGHLVRRRSPTSGRTRLVMLCSSPARASSPRDPAAPTGTTSLVLNQSSSAPERLRNVGTRRALRSLARTAGTNASRSWSPTPSPSAPPPARGSASCSARSTEQGDALAGGRSDRSPAAYNVVAALPLELPIASPRGHERTGGRRRRTSWMILWSMGRSQQ
jgi:hypothetical protein